MCKQCEARVTIASNDVRRFSKILSARIQRDGFVTDARRAQLAELKAKLAMATESRGICNR